MAATTIVNTGGQKQTISTALLSNVNPFGPQAGVIQRSVQAAASPIHSEGPVRSTNPAPTILHTISAKPVGIQPTISAQVGYAPASVTPNIALIQEVATIPVALQQSVQAQDVDSGAPQRSTNPTPVMLHTVSAKPVGMQPSISAEVGYAPASVTRPIPATRVVATQPPELTEPTAQPVNQPPVVSTPTYTPQTQTTVQSVQQQNNPTTGQGPQLNTTQNNPDVSNAPVQSNTAMANANAPVASDQGVTTNSGSFDNLLGSGTDLFSNIQSWMCANPLLAIGGLALAGFMIFDGGSKRARRS